MSQYSDSTFNFDDPNTSWYKTFNLIPEKSLVMDLGCSSGVFGEALINQKGCTVDGIEIDDGDIEKAKLKLRKVYKINVETEEINVDEEYDIVFMGDVIEHLANPIQTLKKVKKLLKPSGYLVFSMPNITHISVRMMLLKGEINYGKTGLLDETHLHFYNREEIYRVLNNAGLKIDRFDFTINDMPFNLAKSELLKLGLKPTKEFNRVLDSVNGKAYQFIGSARSSQTVTKQKLPKLSPPNIIGEHIKDLKESYEKVIDDLAEDRKKVSDDRDRILADRNKLDKELSKLQNRWYKKYPEKVTRAVQKKLKKGKK